MTQIGHRLFLCWCNCTHPALFYGTQLRNPPALFYRHEYPAPSLFYGGEYYRGPRVTQDDEARVREALAEEILKEAGIDQRVETSIARVSDAFGDDELESYVEEALARQPVDCWRDPLTTRADELADEALAQ